MPICQNCHQQWKWKQTVKKMFTLDTGMICPYCGKKQFLTSEAKKRNNIVIFFTPLIMLIGLIFSIPPEITLVLIVLNFFVIISVYPLMINLANDEDLNS